MNLPRFPLFDTLLLCCKFLDYLKGRLTKSARSVLQITFKKISRKKYWATFMVESAFGLELNFAEIKLHLSALFEKFRITLTFFDKNTHLLPPTFSCFSKIQACWYYNYENFPLLNLSCIILKNCQAYFKNFAVLTQQDF